MRKFFFILLTFAITLSYILKYDNVIVHNFSFLNDIKSLYLNKVIEINSYIDKHLKQVQTIDILVKKYEELKEYKLLYEIAKNKLNAIQTESDLNPEIKDYGEISFVKAISYVNFNDVTKIWLDEPKNNDNIYGLIMNNYAAGIVLNDNNQSLGLLNGNLNCSYAGFAGEEKAPGIITSVKNSNSLIIKFIPVWAELKIGDEVVTSGLDNIFPQGIKVGIVTKIVDYHNMRTALIKPYINPLNKRYFYIFKSKKYHLKKDIRKFNIQEDNNYDQPIKITKGDLKNKVN